MLYLWNVVAPVPEPERPTRLGAYELVKVLKSGGMAKLYLGRREGLGGFSRYLALKTVHSHLAEDEAFIQMFLDEARLAAQLSPPPWQWRQKPGRVKESGGLWVAAAPPGTP